MKICQINNFQIHKTLSNKKFSVRGRIFGKMRFFEEFNQLKDAKQWAKDNEDRLNNNSKYK